MQFIAELVFSGNTSPDDEIIDWLLNCVTLDEGTRKFSIYRTSDVVDPTPVLRSYLLKLLLQVKQSKRVDDYLEGFIDKAVNHPSVTNLNTLVLLIDISKVSKQAVKWVLKG